jgi:hypothetical protein
VKWLSKNKFAKILNFVEAKIPSEANHKKQEEPAQGTNSVKAEIQTEAGQRIGRIVCELRQSGDTN